MMKYVNRYKLTPLLATGFFENNFSRNVQYFDKIGSTIYGQLNEIFIVNANISSNDQRQIVHEYKHQLMHIKRQLYTTINGKYYWIQNHQHNKLILSDVQLDHFKILKRYIGRLKYNF